VVKAFLGAVLIWVGVRQRRRMGRPRKQPGWMARLDSLPLWTLAGLGVFLQPWSLVAAGAATVVQAKLSTAGDWLTLVLFCLLRLRAVADGLGVHGLALGRAAACERHRVLVRLRADRCRPRPLMADVLYCAQALVVAVRWAGSLPFGAARVPAMWQGPQHEQDDRDHPCGQYPGSSRAWPHAGRRRQ
jgi:Sap, sulfolipid-1-addressing protein